MSETDNIDIEGKGPSVRESFRGPQVCKIVGITYRQLDYWARSDVIRPSLHDAAGSGTQRLYSYNDLVELKVVKRLLDSGIALQTARKAINYLRDNLDENLSSAHLVLEGERSLLAFSNDQIIDLVREGQGVLNIIALAPVKADIDAMITVAPVPATSLPLVANG